MRNAPGFTPGFSARKSAPGGAGDRRRTEGERAIAGKYVHISNAGLATPNPGINTVQVSVGYHWFK